MAKSIISFFSLDSMPHRWTCMKNMKTAYARFCCFPTPKPKIQIGCSKTYNILMDLSMQISNNVKENWAEGLNEDILLKGKCTIKMI